MNLSNVLKIGMSNTKHFHEYALFIQRLRLAFGSADKYASNFKVLGSMEFNVWEEMILVKVTLYFQTQIIVLVDGEKKKQKLAFTSLFQRP